MVADEIPERLEAVVALLREAGHTVVAAETDLDGVRDVVERHEATLAVVSVHSEPDHALRLIETINDTSSCPVVLVLDDDDPAVVRAAIERGLDAYATSPTVEALENAIELARRRFSEFEQLGRQIHHMEAGAARRSVIERAKGVLMERHEIDERTAYELLRSSARDRRVSLVEVAQSVLTVRDLLPKRRESES